MDDKQIHDRIAELVLELEAKRVCDLGCGSGELYDALKEKRYDKPYLGCDCDPDVLKQAEDKGAKVLEATLEWLDLRRYSQDVVILKDVPNALVELRCANNIFQVARRYVIIAQPNTYNLYQFANSHSFYLSHEEQLDDYKLTIWKRITTH